MNQTRLLAALGVAVVVALVIWPLARVLDRPWARLARHIPIVLVVGALWVCLGPGSQTLRLLMAALLVVHLCLHESWAHGLVDSVAAYRWALRRNAAVLPPRDRAFGCKEWLLVCLTLAGAALLSLSLAQCWLHRHQ